MAMSKIKWAEIKIEYITNRYTTLEELMEKYKVSEAALKNACSKEGWVEQRNLYFKKLDEEILNKQREIDLSQWQTRNTKHQEIAEMILNKIEKALIEDKFDNKADTYNKLLSSLERAQLIERKCFGQDKDSTQVNDVNIIVKLPQIEGEDE